MSAPTPKNGIPRIARIGELPLVRSPLPRTLTGVIGANVLDIKVPHPVRSSLQTQNCERHSLVFDSFMQCHDDTIKHAHACARHPRMCAWTTFKRQKNKTAGNCYQYVSQIIERYRASVAGGGGGRASERVYHHSGPSREESVLEQGDGRACTCVCRRLALEVKERRGEASLTRTEERTEDAVRVSAVFAP